MYLIFSGEGSTDMGTGEFQGPMLYLIDRIIESDRRFGYSILDVQSYGFISRRQLSDVAKNLRPLPKEQPIDNIRLSGKKSFQETGEFYSNARALTMFASELCGEKGLVVAVLFQDSDTVDQQEWQRKWDSIVNGFNAAQFHHGVPTLPKPVSEAWILCAIYRQNNQARDCSELENRRRGNQEDHALKYELEKQLKAIPERELLNRKIDSGEIDHNNINLPSFNAFKKRLTEVL
ncbi:MAG: hypothetical protein LBP59_20725 [Planctomycetaceae bacterium]|jgi:hypothetical protein|nr:hypothetical protein [Planctomycetaceae bacterium]